MTALSPVIRVGNKIPSRLSTSWQKRPKEKDGDKRQEKKNGKLNLKIEALFPELN